jgi:hypothetical protein
LTTVDRRVQLEFDRVVTSFKGETPSYNELVGRAWDLGAYLAATMTEAEYKELVAIRDRRLAAERGPR